MVRHSFDPAYNAPSGYDTNKDGADPQGGLILSSNMLYGTASAGGSSGMGTVFALNTNGTGFRILHSFTAPTITNTDGVGPGGGLVISGNGNVLYGAASGGGGTGDSGTAFSLSFPPQLAMTTAGLNLRLSWPTNFTGFALQSTTNLASPVWTTNSAPPVVVNGQNTVTNSISGTHQFFRLSR